jgi:hypothetical protein
MPVARFRCAFARAGLSDLGSGKESLLALAGLHERGTQMSDKEQGELLTALARDVREMVETSRAANPLNSQFNRLWNAPEPFSPEGNRIAQDPNFLAA